METKVYFSNRAFSSVIAETMEHSKTETGGVFLGKKVNDTWYVLETVNSGPKAHHSKTYFEYDRDYINYVANKLSRLYRNEIDLIGIWHQHVNDSYSFSGIDDETNEQFANLSSSGILVGLISRKPSIKLRVFHKYVGEECQKMNYEIGDSFIPIGIRSFRGDEIISMIKP